MEFSTRSGPIFSSSSAVVRSVLVTPNSSSESVDGKKLGRVTLLESESLRSVSSCPVSDVDSVKDVVDTDVEGLNPKIVGLGLDVV